MHGTEVLRGTEPTNTETRFAVAGISRVEGEGSLKLRVRNGIVEEAHLAIFEAPRYFERLVIGRTPNEVLDIVARICGICPVAYQMSGAHAFEHLAGIAVDPQVRALRRLLYCGEWIESHALHVYLLHAPDFFGCANAIELAAIDRAAVERGLALKKVGNRIVSVIGGRPIHPVSVRVGGFSRVPTVDELAVLRPDLERALDWALHTVDWVSGFDVPAHDRSIRFVSLVHPDEYPMNDGRIVSTDGINLAPTDWPTAFHEDQVEWSHALQARAADGTAYLLGPAARITLAADQLHPIARQALDRIGLAGQIRRNPHWSIAARAIELVHATAEALDIVRDYQRPDAPAVAGTPRDGIAAWATEAPRGLLFHRYELDSDGLIAHATIVPPTSQNQAAIEEDLASFAPSVLDLPHEVAQHRLEQLIRSYDPCISCATHFLDVRVEEV